MIIKNNSTETENIIMNPNESEPLYAPEQISVRVQSVTDKGVNLVLYQTAKQAISQMDLVYGTLGWKDEYKVLDNYTMDKNTTDGKTMVVCVLSVKDPNTGEWISKMDVGSPSNMESEKGLFSDCFKRTSVKFLRAPRALYSAPKNIFIPAGKGCTLKEYKGKKTCFDKFAVSAIEYDEYDHISLLKIINEATGAEVYSWTKKKPDSTKPSGEVISKIKSLAKEAGVPESYICKKFTITDLTELPPQKATALMNGFDRCKASYEKDMNQTA